MANLPILLYLLKMSCTDLFFEHLLPSWSFSVGRLWNPEEVRSEWQIIWDGVLHVILVLGHVPPCLYLGLQSTPTGTPSITSSCFRELNHPALPPMPLWTENLKHWELK